MIRIARTSDHIAMDAVFRSAVRELCKASYNSAIIEAWAGKPWPERFNKSTNDGNEQFVFLSDNEVICFGVLNIEKRLLSALFVDPKYSSQGFGKKMAAHLMKKAKAAGIDFIRVDSTLNAVEFYKAIGFSETGRSEYTTQNGVVMKSV